MLMRSVSRALGLACVLFSLEGGRAEPGDRCDFAKATRERPCSLRSQLGFDDLLDAERRLVARAADAPATEHNIRAADAVVAELKGMVRGQRTYFEKVCGLWVDLDARIVAIEDKH